MEERVCLNHTLSLCYYKMNNLYIYVKGGQKMKTEKEKMIQGEMYIPADPVLVKRQGASSYINEKIK